MMQLVFGLTCDPERIGPRARPLGAIATAATVAVVTTCVALFGVLTMA
jgi:hypothetical protein